MSRFGFGSIVGVVIFTVLLLGGRSRFFRDPGTFWHTATGQVILEQRSFITTDPFSYTFGGKEWTPYEWLGEVGMAIAHRLGGFDLLLILSVGLLAITFAILAQRLYATGLHWAACACVTGLAIASASNHFHVRPHLITMAFLAFSMITLAKIESGNWSISRLLMLVPIFIIWTNTHGGALGGYATVAIVLAGWLGLAIIKRDSPIKSWSDAGLVIGCGLAIAATVICTPYGMDIFHIWHKLMSMPELKSFVIEHMPATITKSQHAPFFVFGVLYLFVLSGLRQWPRMTWLIPLVWFALGWDRCRHESLFAIVAFVAMADIFPKTRWAKLLESKRPDFYEPHLNRSTNVLGIVISIVLLMATIFVLRTNVPKGYETISESQDYLVAFDHDKWPISLLDDLHREADGQGNLPIFNEYNLGGFLIWFTPEYRPFVDDRCEVYGGAWLKRFVDHSKGDPDEAREYLDEMQLTYGKFHHALTKRESAFDLAFRHDPMNWKLINETAAHAFYRRIKN